MFWFTSRDIVTGLFKCSQKQNVFARKQFLFYLWLSKCITCPFLRKCQNYCYFYLLGYLTVCCYCPIVFSIFCFTFITSKSKLFLQSISPFLFVFLSLILLIFLSFSVPIYVYIYLFISLSPYFFHFLCFLFLCSCMAFSLYTESFRCSTLFESEDERLLHDDFLHGADNARTGAASSCDLCGEAGLDNLAEHLASQHKVD